MPEKALEPDVIETPEQTEEPEQQNGGRVLDLAIYEAHPGGAIRTNIDDIVESVESMLDELGTWDVVDEETYRAAKETRAHIRKTRNVIENERRRLKDLYEGPLRSFEAQVKRATGPLGIADLNFKKKITDYEARVASQRKEVLAQHYEELSPDFAALVPFDRFLDLRAPRGSRGNDFVWLRRATPEYKALSELEGTLLGVVKEWDALGARCSNPQELDTLHAYYAETLDVGLALTRYQEDREREETIRQQRVAEQEWLESQRQDQEKVNQSVQSSALAPERVFEWTVTLRATVSGARRLAEMLRGAGYTGHITKGQEVTEG